MSAEIKQIDIFVDLEQRQTQTKKIKMVPFFKHDGETPPGILCACTDCGRYSRYCSCMVEDGQQWDVSTRERVDAFIKLIEAT